MANVIDMFRNPQNYSPYQFYKDWNGGTEPAPYQKQMVGDYNQPEETSTSDLIPSSLVFYQRQPLLELMKEYLKNG